MSRRLTALLGLFSSLAVVCGGCADGPSAAAQRQDAAIHDPMGYQVNPPKSVDEGSPFKDLNDAFFMP